MKLLKKAGSILFCLLPALLAFAIQIVVTFAGIFLWAFLLIWKDPTRIRQNGGAAFLTDIISLTEDSQFLVLLTASYATIAALALGFWYWKRFVPKHRPRRKPSALLHPSMLAGMALLVFGLQYISNYLALLVAAINPGWYETYERMMESIGFGDITPALVLYSVIIAPISEELIFRGVTLSYAVRAMPFFAANTLQAFLFGLFHGNAVQGVYAFVAGLFCGYICQKGGSLWLSILFHMMFNLWGTFAPGFLSYTGGLLPLHLVIFAAASAVTLCGIALYQKGLALRGQTP